MRTPMRAFLRLLPAAALLAATLAPAVPAAQAANLDTIADHVLGQPDFGHNGASLTAAGLHYTDGVAVDPRTGRVFVADAGHNRVLSWPNALALTNGAAADLVLGQSTFITSTANNGGRSAASLNGPSGLALDAFGNLYVADSGNNRVLEYYAPLSIHAAASVVLGQPGFNTGDVDHGGLNEYGLDYPTGLAVDSHGNLFVADTDNNRILQFQAPLSTHVPAVRVFGQFGFNTSVANAPGLNAGGLNSPQGLALDAQDNLWAADQLNNRVLEYKTPLAGSTAAELVIGQPTFMTNTVNNGGLNASGLFFPTGVALDAQGDLYVTDAANNRVLGYSAPFGSHAAAGQVFGQPSVFTSTANNGGLNASGLAQPFAAAVDARGDLLVADSQNYRVLEYDTPMAYAAPAISSLSPALVAAGGPTFKLTVNGSGFVSGSVVRWQGSNRPTTFLSSTQLQAAIPAADIASGGPFAVTVFTPAPGGGTSALINLPLYARAAGDTLADSVFGQPSFTASAEQNALLPGSAAQVTLPGCLALDPRTGRLFVCDIAGHRVLSWPNAVALANAQPADLVLGQPSFARNASDFNVVSAASLSFPEGLAVDGQGNLYVADFFANRVLEYAAPLSSGMAASLVFGQGGSFTTHLVNNGGVSPNSLNGPMGLALDARGNLYVADTNNSRVLEYDTPLSHGTTADRVFGQPTFISNTGNYSGLNASGLAAPNGLALDAAGNLYVADTFNNRVLEYDAPLSTGAAAERVFGQPGPTTGAANNPALNGAGLNTPVAVAVDTAGNVFVADKDNYRLLEYDAPLITDRVADRVLGQPDLFHNAINNGGTSTHSLTEVLGVVLDAHGDLFVSDGDNNRVLAFDRPLPLIKLFLPLLRR